MALILNTVAVETFKRIDQVEILLSGVTILVGTNGSGKSSIIQALHLSATVIRQADRVDPNKTTTVGVDHLDYLPTEDYWSLGHNSNWGNSSTSPGSKARFVFADDSASPVAYCTLRSARNAGISITGQVPSELTSLMRDKSRFFSAYIPGISGIPNREEKRSRKVVLKACSYGDSNVILRNVLLLLKNDGKLGELETWLGNLIGPIKIHVKHNEQEDLVIESWADLGGVSKPLELLGTGYLQLIQLFSYILLFSPGILLIDEPDIHLHPSIQEKLVQALASVAQTMALRVVLTTHSPFIVRGAPPSANVYWVKDGKIESSNREEVELALGWGAFGKKVLMISEDAKNVYLRKLIAQWPQLERVVAFQPGTGYKFLPTPERAAELSNALGGKFRILIHRDRDSLTDDEVADLTSRYEAVGVDLWVPRLSDVEAYFVLSSQLAELAGISLADADAALQEMLTRFQSDVEAQFAKHRAAHNAELHAAGTARPNAEILSAFQSRDLRGAKGKYILGKLKDKFGQQKLSDAAIVSHKFQSEVAPDLREKLQQVAAKQ